VLGSAIDHTESARSCDSTGSALLCFSQSLVETGTELVGRGVDELSSPPLHVRRSGRDAHRGDSDEARKANPFPHAHR
jgi:hypothetical protein